MGIGYFIRIDYRRIAERTRSRVSSSFTPQFTQYDIQTPFRCRDTAFLLWKMISAGRTCRRCRLFAAPAFSFRKGRKNYSSSKVRLLSIFTWMPSSTSLRKKWRSSSASMIQLAKLMVSVSSKLMMAQLVREEKGWPM